MKKCSVCNIEKSLEEFGPDKRASDGRRCTCYECRKTDWANNRNHHLDIARKSQAKHRVQRLQDRRDYYEQNKEKIIASQLKRQKHRLKTDPIYKIKRNLRNRLYYALRGASKSKRTLELLGCSVQELKTHIESQFLTGMTWENYTSNGWHIDHIKPCDSFDLKNPKEQETCFHYTNLQPLWGIDNIRKSNKLDS